MNPEALRLAASQALEQDYSPPQRYGTAFHLSPPITDVRDLRVPAVGRATKSSWNDDFTRLPESYQQIIMKADLTDVYVAWQLANLNNNQIRIIHVEKGQSRILSLPASGLFWLFIDEGARVTIKQSAVNHALLLNRLFIWQERKSRLFFFGLRANVVFLNEKVEVHLTGSEAVCKVTQLTFGQKMEQTDIEVQVYHKAPRTESKLLARSAVTGQSRAIYRGLIDVDELAVAAEGYQSARGLLLSRRAVIDSLPELSIRTNDVQCSHGVTTTHLDELSLFYLRSRGLSIEQAREQALRGFFHHQLEIPLDIAQKLNEILLQSTANAHASEN